MVTLAVETSAAMTRLLKASWGKETGFWVGCRMTWANASSVAPGRDQVEAVRPGDVPRVDRDADDPQDREEHRRRDEETEKLEHRLAAERHRAAAAAVGADGRPGSEHRAGLAGHRAPPFSRIWP